MTIGSVLDETWTLYTRFFLRFFLIALGVFAVVNVLYALLLEAVGSGSSGMGLLVAVLTLAIGTVGTFWLQGVFVHAVRDARGGTGAGSGIADLYRRVMPVLGALVGAGVLAGVAIAVGLLLVVPGLVLLTWWAFIAPVIVLERQRIRGSFGRSRQLVRGNGWTVFGLILITALLSAVAALLLQAAFSSFPRFVEIVVGGTIASAAVSPFSAIAMTLAYLRVRELEPDPSEPALP